LGRLDARLDVPVWIDPGGTTIVDLARVPPLIAAEPLAVT
jgi:hypothetical protein